MNDLNTAGLNAFQKYNPSMMWLPTIGNDKRCRVIAGVIRDCLLDPNEFYRSTRGVAETLAHHYRNCPNMEGIWYFLSLSDLLWSFLELHPSPYHL